MQNSPDSLNKQLQHLTNRISLHESLEHIQVELLAWLL